VRKEGNRRERPGLYLPGRLATFIAFDAIAAIHGCLFYNVVHDDGWFLGVVDLEGDFIGQDVPNWSKSFLSNNAPQYYLSPPNGTELPHPLRPPLTVRPVSHQSPPQNSQKVHTSPTHWPPSASLLAFPTPGTDKPASFGFSFLSWQQWRALRSRIDALAVNPVMDYPLQ
jgi:hypothetical protein